jgi:hypothetical protein
MPAESGVRGVARPATLLETGVGWPLIARADRPAARCWQRSPLDIANDPVVVAVGYTMGSRPLTMSWVS